MTAKWPVKRLRKCGWLALAENIGNVSMTLVLSNGWLQLAAMAACGHLWLKIRLA